MAQGIYYNQEVTAEMLNGIAADLGHTSFNGFGTDKFGADALNNITKDLVSAGVLLVGNKCRVVKDSDGNIILQDGIIVFENGAKMEIAEPITIDADNGTVIYALNDTTEGKCTIEVAESYPTEGDFAKLCTIGSDGTLNDNRTIAKGKMELNAGNCQETYEATANIYNNQAIIATIPKTVWDIYNNIIISHFTTTDGYLTSSGILSKSDIEKGFGWGHEGGTVTHYSEETDEDIMIYAYGNTYIDTNYRKFKTTLI